MHDSTRFTLLLPVLYANQMALASSWAETSRIGPPLEKTRTIDRYFRQQAL